MEGLQEERRELEVMLVTTQMELRRVQLSQGRADTEVGHTASAVLAKRPQLSAELGLSPLMLVLTVLTSFCAVPTRCRAALARAAPGGGGGEDTAHRHK